ncbi:MAG: hypothetical protein DRP85_00850 [Candidatus Makaraimicrobium thalassicum]|nr:MAG: hypothetical protein DRP85_00850 [Candidatus Omnitrophota bacterium]
MALTYWWHPHWQNRVRLYSEPSGSPYSSGVHFLCVQANLNYLISRGLLRNDFGDLRVIAQKSDHAINIPYYIASGISPARIYFAVQNNIPSNVNIGELDDCTYYLYFNNSSGNLEELPGAYQNINFPQAPYSCHPDWIETPYGKYRDKYLFRLNDDPNDPRWFTDATNHGQGESKDYINVQKGHSGVLDTCTYFNGYYYNASSGSWIEIPQDDKHWAHPSGDWCIDFWCKPETAGRTATAYIFAKVKSTFDTENFPVVAIYQSNDDYYIFARCLFSSQEDLHQEENSYVPSGEWHHYRIAYRTGGDYLYSRIQIYRDGKLVNKYNGNSVDTQAYAENTAFFGGDLTSAFIGRKYGQNGSLYTYKGWLEQLRYSTFVYPAISGTTPLSLYQCAPDWIDNQYITYTGQIEYKTSTHALFGGFTLSDAPALSGLFGGIAHSLSGFLSYFGGIISTVIQSPENLYGGLSWSNILQSGLFGALLWCSYDDTDFTITEALGRVLIKANSDNVVQQSFVSDAAFTFYGQQNSEFDGTLNVRYSYYDEFDAKLIVGKTRKNPFVMMLNGPESGTVPYTYIAVASGYAFDKDNNAIEGGIHYVAFIWGDNDSTIISNPVNSGSIWSAQHTYYHSGIYRPIVIVRDKYGRSGGDFAYLNLASGLALPSGESMPFVSLSGSPRKGLVPPPLYVDFTVSISGVNSYNLYWDFGNGITQYNNSLQNTTQYILPGDYIPWVRLDDGRIYVVDTLRLGYNR